MKKLILLVLFVWGSAVSYGETSFAILPVENGSGVSQSDASSLENSLYEHLFQSKRYRIIDRNNLEKILKEQRLYLSGVLDEGQAVELGKVAGVEKIIVSKIYKKDGDLAAMISVIDVQTSQVEFNSEIDEANLTADTLGRVCVARIMGEYPLLGKVLGKSGDIVVISLGSTHGLKPGMRVFVTRKEVLKDDEGNILFAELKRVGTLTVTTTDRALAKTKIRKLTPGFTGIQKGDIISVSVYPNKEPVVSYTSLLGEVKKGRQILQDDMKKKYLSLNNNQGKDYYRGRLYFDSTHNNSGHVYGTYPAPYNDLADYILEAEFEFQEVSSKYNKMSIDFRVQGPYTTESGYSFYIHDEGEFAVYLFRLGSIFNLVPLQSSPALNRGTSKNKMKIIAVGDTFDLYLNDQFVAAFQDETLESGGVMVKVNYGGSMALDTVKIWEVER